MWMILTASSFNEAFNGVHLNKTFMNVTSGKLKDVNVAGCQNVTRNLIVTEAHYPERPTAINSCNSVFTSRFILR